MKPIVLVRRLKTTRQQKCVLTAIFACTGFVCIIAIIRLEVLARATRQTDDPTWALVPVAIWSAAEPAMGVIAACLPSLRPLFAVALNRNHIEPNLSVGTSRSRIPAVPMEPGDNSVQTLSILRSTRLVPRKEKVAEFNKYPVFSNVKQIPGQHTGHNNFIQGGSKPKNARSKRELAKREPLQTENTKTALFLRCTKTSSLLTSLTTDLYTLKVPNAIRFTKGNSIHPFEDASSLEFFSQKNDASLLLFSSHSKKRPHTLTWIRCFGNKVLDLLELHVVEDTARRIAQFKGEKTRLGLKPMISFSGTAWDDSSRTEYVLAKSMLADFFKGPEVGEVDVEGLQLLISFFVGEESERDNSSGTKPQIQMRVWRLVTKRSGTKIPKVEVEEIGPRIDFRVGRSRTADGGVMKEALKRAKKNEAKPKKNVETDLMGDKMGRIHLGRQDLNELQTRKMKGLKRGRDEATDVGHLDDGMEDVVSVDDEDTEGDEGGVDFKRVKVA
ncbi:MAG: rRNA-binding ribosome biosynthesis protein rpf2 [Ramalina farinacea]|uniref:Ribosome production factor 2 homolog n=1 Tax=Ramalina farinacea TaxID=258253 RepID=A0AA43QSI0_9LECA|nr:rRNA-binding ribosome biosynthesis protein rpf2 [Ramalina farinacea]